MTITGSLDRPAIPHINECTRKVQLALSSDSIKSSQVTLVALVVLEQEPQLEEMPYETAVQFGTVEIQLNVSIL